MRKVEDTKGVIRIRRSKKDKSKKTKGQTIIYKTLHRKLKIDQHEPQEKLWMDSGAVDG
jgi:hypothetical protein